MTIKSVLLSVAIIGLVAGSAFAGMLPKPTPLPLAGVAGPFGPLAAAAGYGVYRAVKYFGRPR